MKSNGRYLLVPFFLSILPNLSLAEKKLVQASDVCVESAKLWSKKGEAKQTSTKANEIKDSETKLLGSGANLFLVSVFVDGPNTGDNTHWEVVGEFDYKTDRCKIIVGRRYQAH